MKKLTAILFATVILAILSALPVFAADTELIISASQFSTVGMLPTQTKTTGGRTFVYSSPDTSVTGSAFAFNLNTNIEMSKYTYAKVSYYSNTASENARINWDYATATAETVSLTSDGKITKVIIPLKSGLSDKKSLIQLLPFGTAKANTLDANIEFGLEYVGLFATLEDAESYDPEIEETDASPIGLTSDKLTYVGSKETSIARRYGHTFTVMSPDTTITTGSVAGNFANLAAEMSQYRYAKIGYRSNTASEGYLRWNYANCTPAIDFENTDLAYSEIVTTLNTGLIDTKSLLQILPFGTFKANTLDGNAEFHLEYVALFGNLADAQAFAIDPVYYVTTDESEAVIDIASGAENSIYTDGDVTFTIKAEEGYIAEKVAYTVDGESETVLTASSGIYTIEAGKITGDISITASSKEEKYTLSGEVTLERENSIPTTSNLAKLTILKDGSIVYETEEEATNENGSISYTFTGKPGIYTLSVIKNGYISYSADIDLSSDKTLDIKLIAGDIKGAYTDTHGDGMVDIDDFIRVLRGFSLDSSDELISAVDINEDGEANVTDLGYVKTNFGKNTASYE